VTERLASDKKVVSANWFAERFKGCSNPARVFRVFCGEVHYLEWT